MEKMKCFNLIGIHKFKQINRFGIHKKKNNENIA